MNVYMSVDSLCCHFLLEDQYLGGLAVELVGVNVAVIKLSPKLVVSVPSPGYSCLQNNHYLYYPSSSINKKTNETKTKQCQYHH